MKINLKIINLVSIFLVLMVLTLLLPSCEVTELEPINAISETEAFSNPELIEKSVVGVYNAAQSGFYDPLNGGNNQTRGYPFGAASFQQGDCRGEDMIDIFGFYRLTYTTTYTAATPNNVNMWSTLYALINQANVTIKGVQGAENAGTISSELALQYEAEMRFLRALAYHELLIHFCRPYADNPTASEGGVPLQLTSISVPEDVATGTQVRRASVADVYTQILADLDFAEANAPASRSGNLQYFRVVQGAAIALKVRVKLHQGDWAGVLLEGNKLAGQNSAPFSGAGYSLLSSPGACFAGGSVTSENIFTLENNAQDNGGVNGSLPSQYNNRELVAVSPIMWANTWFLSGDLRRTDDSGDDLIRISDGTGNTRKGVVFSNKYKDATNLTDNTPTIRYAEVLLCMAEAEARLNGLTPRALELLNAIRNRAVTNVADQFTIASFSSAEELITAILRERRIEFLAEGKRWGDIHRLALVTNTDQSPGGIPAKFGFSGLQGSSYNLPIAAPSFAAIPQTDFRFIWPIPQLELVNNPSLVQNPGW